MSPQLIIANGLHVYSYIMIAAVISTWLPIPRDNPIIKAMDQITEPVLAPIRAILNPQMTGGLDFSPIVALFALQALGNLIRGL